MVYSVLRFGHNMRQPCFSQVAAGLLDHHPCGQQVEQNPQAETDSWVNGWLWERICFQACVVKSQSLSLWMSPWQECLESVDCWSFPAGSARFLMQESSGYISVSFTARTIWMHFFLGASSWSVQIGDMQSWNISIIIDYRVYLSNLWSYLVTVAKF